MSVTLTLTLTLNPSPDQIKKCKTDSIKGVGYHPDRPEANNLLGIYEAS